MGALRFVHARCNGVDAQVVGDARARPGTDQQVGDGEVVTMRGPMERGRAVALRRVDIDSDVAAFSSARTDVDVLVLDRLRSGA